MPSFHLSEARAAELIATANTICSPGRGILAADESTGTIKKRFDAADIPCTEANRAAYRALLFTTPDLNKYISGAILYEETLFQKTAEGIPMTELLARQNIVPGIKVDAGLTVLPGTAEETATLGLDGLDTRCKKYYEAGARFAKWRAVLKINAVLGLPSALSIAETASTLARYAAICQVHGLVPIVEPEILNDGDHTIELCAQVTERVLAAVFKALNDHGVLLEGCLLKPNMVLSGYEAAKKATAAEVGSWTLQTLQRTCPPALVGVVFLSGGQSEEEASVNLSAINAAVGKKPWALTFSYGRALQASTIKTWAGKAENVQAAQTVLLARAKANGEAALGKYAASTQEQGESLHVKNYVY